MQRILRRICRHTPDGSRDSSWWNGITSSVRERRPNRRHSSSGSYPVCTRKGREDVTSHSIREHIWSVGIQLMKRNGNSGAARSKKIINHISHFLTTYVKKSIGNGALFSLPLQSVSKRLYFWHLQSFNYQIIREIKLLIYIVTSNKFVKFVCRIPKSLQKPQLHCLHLPTLI